MCVIVSGSHARLQTCALLKPESRSALQSILRQVSQALGGLAFTPFAAILLAFIVYIATCAQRGELNA
eukprot:4497459-Pleurochrysis_carterae.AAC.3